MVLVTIVGATGLYDIAGIVGLLWYNRYRMLYCGYNILHSTIDIQYANYGTVGVVYHSGHCNLVGRLQRHRMTYTVVGLLWHSRH